MTARAATLAAEALELPGEPGDDPARAVALTISRSRGATPANVHGCAELALAPCVAYATPR